MFMYLFNIMCDFLLAAWLWHMTFDWFHPLVTGIVMFFMMRLVMRKKRLVSLWVSSSAQFFAMMFFFLVVIGGLIHGLSWNFEPHYVPRAPDEFYASLSVALIYIIFQTIYFALGRIWCTYKLLPYFFIVVISNSVGMIFGYVLARMAIAWSYVG